MAIETGSAIGSQSHPPRMQTEAGPDYGNTSTDQDGDIVTDDDVTMPSKRKVDLAIANSSTSISSPELWANVPDRDPAKSDFGSADSLETRAGVTSSNYIWQWADKYNNMGDAERGQLHNLLVVAGYLDFDKVRDLPFGQRPVGRIGEKAFQNALVDAYTGNRGIYDYLEEMFSQNIDGFKARLGGGSGASGPKRPMVQLISEDDANSLADDVGRMVAGRGLTPEEKARVVKRIHATQRSEQNSYIDQQMAGGGEAAQPTDLKTVAEGAIREMAPVETGAHDVADQFAKLMGIVNGQRPQ